MPYDVNIKETQKLTGNITIGERGPQGETGPQGPRGEAGSAYITQQSVTTTNESNVLELLSNVYYIINNTNTHGILTIALTGIQEGLCNEFLGEVTSSSSVFFSFPEGTRWLTNGVDVVDNQVVILPSKKYVFSVVNGLGVVCVYE